MHSVLWLLSVAILRLFSCFEIFVFNVESSIKPNAEQNPKTKHWLHWHSQKFLLGGARNGKILLSHFGDVFRWRNCNGVTEMTSLLIFLSSTLVMMSLKTHYLAKSHNFRPLILEVEVKGAGGGEPPAFGDFWKFDTKIMHFRLSQLKFSLKIWNLFIISSWQCEATFGLGKVWAPCPLATHLTDLYTIFRRSVPAYFKYIVDRKNENNHYAQMWNIKLLLLDFFYKNQ